MACMYISLPCIYIYIKYIHVYIYTCAARVLVYFRVCLAERSLAELIGLPRQIQGSYNSHTLDKKII